MNNNQIDIATRFAKRYGFDIAQHCANKGGFSYFRLDFSNRPRYTGHPSVIKISTAGKVLAVTDIDEVYWAVSCLQ